MLQNRLYTGMIAYAETIYVGAVSAVATFPDFGAALDMPEAAPNRVLETLSDNKNGYKLDLYPVRERRGLVRHWARTFGPLATTFTTSSFAA